MKPIFQVLLLFCLLTTTACEKKVSENGTAGTLTWTLTGDGNLIIRGQGAMPDYDVINASYSPWYEYRGEIKTLTIDDGVTSIGDWAFYGCDALTSVAIMSVTPQGLYDSDNFAADGDTLYVPAGCVGVYKANMYWGSAFTYIVEQQ